MTTTAPTLLTPSASATGRPQRTARRETPVVLRMIAVSIVLLALLAGVAGALATVVRQSATSASWQTAEPLMVTAQTIDTSLSDADTTAAASFLQGRVEPATLQQRYDADLTTASADVARAAQEAGSDPAVGAAVTTLSTDLPAYSGVVQEANFNERAGNYPLAAAYLAEANNLMRTSILPAAAQVYGTEVNRLADDQSNAASTSLTVLGGGGLRRPPRRTRPGAAVAEWSVPSHLEHRPGRRDGSRGRAGSLGRGGAFRAEFECGVGRTQRLSTGVDLHGRSDPRPARSSR